MTATGDVAGRLEAVMAGLASQDGVPVRRRTRLNWARWDSLFHLTLILAIEQEFGVTLTDEDVLELNSFDSALLIVTERLVGDRRSR